MKSTPTFLTASALLLVAFPACWQWREIRSLRAVAAGFQSSREAASSARPTPPPSGGSTIGGAASSAVDDVLRSEDIRSLVERLLTLRHRSTQGSIDEASVLEDFRLQRQVKSWPAEAVREALDHLLAKSAGGSARLELVAILLEVAYAVKAPGEATRLALRCVNQDPRFYEAARWSLAQWYVADPGAAEAWVAEQEASGSLAGTGVEDLGKTLVAQGRLLGAVMADPAAAPAAVAASDAVTAEKALRAWIGRLPENLDPSAFVRAAAAIRDPSRAGRVIGFWAKSGPLPVGDASRPAEVDRLLSQIPDDLSPEVRRAALIEGAHWGGTETSLAVLAQVADPSDRVDSLAEATRQLILDGFDPPHERSLLSNWELRPYRNEVAAAVALALGGADGAGGHQNPEAAAAWLERIEDDALRASIAGRLTRP